MSQSHLTSRRAFLRATAGTGAMALSLPALGTSESANEKLDVAVIGVGGMRGFHNLENVAKEKELANIVALCDVDQRQAGKAYEAFPKAERFVDFRKMLDKMDNRIDAVLITTPDHTHAPPAVMAMKLGKHVYCEKPLAHDIHEVRTMSQTAKKNPKVVTQMGNQMHSQDNYRRVVELIQTGAIGTIEEVNLWCPYKLGGVHRPKDKPPVPKELDWDLWLGPAPQRPYHPTYLPKRWRRWLAFGSGCLGDFGCHYMDLPFWALKLRHPTSVEAKGPKPDRESASEKLSVHYEYPARGDMQPVKLNWYDGFIKPPILKKLSADYDEGKEKKGQLMWKYGFMFVGSKGVIMTDYFRHLLLPEKKFADYKRPEPTIPSSIGHYKQWLAACKSGGATSCNFDYGGALTEAVLLGLVAHNVGQKIKWDAANLKAVGCPEADRFIHRPYRKGWVL